MSRPAVLRRRIQALLLFFMAGLVLSGLTALPLERESGWLAGRLGAGEAAAADEFSGLLHWIVNVRNALRATYAAYPFVAYGTDWLAFAHFIVAVFFIGPLKDPMRNAWVIRAGLIACVLVVPFALVCGAIRHIPFFWRLIDCSFGVGGFVPLWLCLKYIQELESIQKS